MIVVAPVILGDDQAQDITSRGSRRTRLGLHC